MRKILTALVLVALGASQAAAQNVLGNPGFEVPLPDPTTPVGDWATFASDMGAATHSLLDPHSGTGHMSLETEAMDQFAGVFQDIDVPVLPGYAVTFSGWHKAVTSPVGSNNEIKFEWAGAPTEVINENPGADYSPFSLTRVAPAGVTDLRVTYAIATFGAGLGDSTVYIDDMSVTVVPEPAAASLLGLGLAGLAARRRHKA